MAGTLISWRGAFAPLAAALILEAAAAPPLRADGIGDENAPPQEICGLCHSMDGVSRMARFPRLAGQNAAYIEKQLNDFREGRRDNDGGQMLAIVTEITPEQVVEVARYFSQLGPPPPIADAPAGEITDQMRELFYEGDEARGIPACASCHLPEMAASAADAVPPDAPHLTAQHPDYIAKQLRDFREGRRQNDVTANMTAIAKALSEAEIDALAVFLGSTTRKVAHAD